MAGLASSVAVRRRTAVLEQELLELVGDTRNGRISARYFGLDGGGGASLQAVGDQYGITRERVRQIVSVVAANLSERKPAVPCLDQVISFALQRAPISASGCEAALFSSGLTAAKFRLEGVIKAAELLGRAAPFFLSEDVNRTVLAPASEREFQNVIRTAQLEVCSWGMTNLQLLMAKVQKQDPQGHYDADFTARALLCRPDFRWLDQKTGWLWLSGLKRNRVLNRVRKILSITNPIPLADLLNGVARHYRMQGFAPPSPVLLELCRQTPGLRVGSSVVLADQPIEPSHVLSPVEHMIFQIFSEHGGKMPRAAVAQKCAESGINQLTIEQYLVYSPILSRYGGGRYGLIGREEHTGTLHKGSPAHR